MSSVAIRLSFIGALIAAISLAPDAADAAGRPDVRATVDSTNFAGATLTAALTVRNVPSRSGARSARTTVRVVAKQGSAARTLGELAVPAMRNGRAKSVTGSWPRSALPVGTWQLRACVDPDNRLRERREGNNCVALGSVTVATPAGPPTPPPPLCSTPNCDPLRLATDTESTYTDSTGTYWVYVPSDLGETPAKVLIWLHGCGGDHGDIWGAADYWEDEQYIAMAPDGTEGGCWDMGTGPDRIVGAVRSVIAHFNVDPKKVVIGGYSSGGDLAYRAAFLHADLFAGLLAMNTSPFRDNSTTIATATAAAWKFPIYHLAHNQDETYPLAGVQAEIDQLIDAGFPVEFEHIDGGHWSDPSSQDAPDGAWWDFQNRVVKDHMGLSWTAP